MKRWLKLPSKIMERLNKLPFASRSAAFRHLGEIADVRSLTAEEQAIYEASLRNYHDTIAIMGGQFYDGVIKGREEDIIQGREEGIQQGREVGIQQGREQVAKAMLDAGIDINTIAGCTGLTTDEIEQLK